TMMCRGIIKGNTIELTSSLPYPEGIEVSVQVEPVALTTQELPSPTKKAVERFTVLIGAGRSGLSDVSQNKHRYLAEAYDERHRGTPEAGR
ncbi:MAG: hypothetical protein HY709_06870, partial [Candidatus Latescibacteria bacterium]|nr:hypothetical protein [Candidatus Latescibacterota bacterium]